MADVEYDYTIPVVAVDSLTLQIPNDRKIPHTQIRSWSTVL